MTSPQPQAPSLLRLLSILGRLPRPLGWLLPFVILILAAPAQALELRVAVEQNARAVQVGASTTATIKDANGKTLGRLKAQMGNMAQVSGGKVDFGNWEGQKLWVEPEGDGLIWIGDRWYRGRVLLSPTGQGLTAVNHVDLEEYLYSVVASEMPTSWPAEALKAQSVAARTYALNKRDRNNPLYDLGDTTKYQVYNGAAYETDSTRSAVESTAGQVLTYNGSLIEAFFHSSSGGHTENVEDVWSKPLPYLRGVPDFDQDSPRYSWTESFSAAQLQQKLSSQVDGLSGLGSIISLLPEQVTPHGRIRTLKVVGQNGSLVVRGNDVRTALGLQSTRFDIQSSGSTKSSGGGFVLRGSGYGHGIGMSQYGARGMAQQGQSYQAILAHYYQGVLLSQVQ
ncbi:MAG: SpoIID/LytB domain-containing protein [Synechococcales cyanobacterium RM1_1_8]|nr:SpoIID/LytB domain-containing protein [Synechococcales cyanobacterium RM1_1_8]